MGRRGCANTGLNAATLMATMNPIAIYQSPTGAADVRLDGDTVWLTQEQMTQLFGRKRSVITKHVRNVFAEGELDEKAMCKICTFPIPTSRSGSTTST